MQPKHPLISTSIRFHFFLYNCLKGDKKNGQSISKDDMKVNSRKNQ